MHGKPTESLFCGLAAVPGSDAMSESHAQEPSIAAEPTQGRESEASALMREPREHEREPGLQIE
jgi:hypothetical protein